MVLAILACFGLILSWAQEDYLFAGVFAAEAAFAVVEAAYLRAGGRSHAAGHQDCTTGAFYGLLDDDQKARLDAVGPRQWGWRGWRWGWGG